MALRNQPYIPLYIHDFQLDEKLINCSAESTGVYIRLICVLHMMDEYGVITLKAKDKQNESNLVNFAYKLTRYMPYQEDVILRSLEELVEEGVVTIDGDRLYQKRMVKDGEISAKRSAAGHRGGKTVKPDTSFESKSENKTVSKNEAKSKQNTVIENVIVNEIENEIIEDKDEEESIVSAESMQQGKNLQDERFDAFWRAYPRKSAKGSARKAWLKISPTQPLFAKIMSALEAAKQCEQWQRDHGQYIPHPATWLNQERWEDDYGEPQLPSIKPKPPDNFDPDNPYADWGDEDE